MSAQDLLEWLKYASFIIAAGSAVFGLLSKSTRDGEDGRKHLTPAGVITIAIVLVTAIIGITSFALETMVKQQSADATKAEKRAEDAAILARDQARQAIEDRERSLRRAEAAAARDQEAATKLSILTAATEARLRDLELARKISTGSADNLARTGIALREIARLTDPIEGLRLEYEVEFDESPAMRAYQTRLVEVSKRAELRGNTVDDEVSFSGTDSLRQMDVRPGSVNFPQEGTPEYNLLMGMTIRLTLFANAADGLRQVRHLSGQADDYRAILLGDIKWLVRQEQVTVSLDLTTHRIIVLGSASIRLEDIRHTNAIRSSADVNGSTALFNLRWSRPPGGEIGAFGMREGMERARLIRATLSESADRFWLFEGHTAKHFRPGSFPFYYYSDLKVRERFASKIVDFD